MMGICLSCLGLTRRQPESDVHPFVITRSRSQAYIQIDIWDLRIALQRPVSRSIRHHIEWTNPRSTVGSRTVEKGTRPAREDMRPDCKVLASILLVHNIADSMLVNWSTSRKTPIQMTAHKSAQTTSGYWMRHFRPDPKSEKINLNWNKNKPPTAMSKLGYRVLLCEIRKTGVGTGMLFKRLTASSRSPLTTSMSQTLSRDLPIWSRTIFCVYTKASEAAFGRHSEARVRCNCLGM